MSYEKQNWANSHLGNTPISAARLSHMEDGIKALSDDIDSRLSDDTLSATYATPATTQRLLEAAGDQRTQQIATTATKAFSDANAWTGKALTKNRTRIVGTKDDATNGLAIGYSDDDGATWTLAENLPVANAKYGEALLVTNDGEVVVVCLNAINTGAYRAYIYRSTGFATDPVTATWALVYTTPFSEQNTAPWGRYHGLDYDGANTIMGAWYDKKTNNAGGVTANSAVRIRRSTDKGVTWTEVFRLDTFLTGLGIDPLAQGYHVHSIAYDPYGDNWIATYGDWTGSAGRAGAVISSDGGTTWTELYSNTSYQSVACIPMLDCLLFLGDGGVSSGVNRMDRNADGTFAAIEKAYTPPFNTAIGHAPFRGATPGDPVLIPLTQITGTNRLSRLLGTTDGEHFYDLYVDNTYTVSGVSGMRYAVGPTSTGKLLGWSVDSRYAGGISLLTITP